MTLAVRRSAVAELSSASVPSKQIPLACALFWGLCGPSLAIVATFLETVLFMSVCIQRTGLWRRGLSTEEPSLESMAGSECFLQIGRCFFFRLLGFWYRRCHAKELVGDSSEVLIGDFHPFVF
jgi:hypothetical protein